MRLFFSFFPSSTIRKIIWVQMINKVWTYCTHSLDCYKRRNHFKSQRHIWRGHITKLNCFPLYYSRTAHITEFYPYICTRSHQRMYIYVVWSTRSDQEALQINAQWITSEKLPCPPNAILELRTRGPLHQLSVWAGHIKTLSLNTRYPLLSSYIPRSSFTTHSPRSRLALVDGMALECLPSHLPPSPQ